ncbi:MAG: hypothetical protein AAF629_34130 [Chloroflexota bacterium]
MTEDMVRTVFQLDSQIVSDPVTQTPMCIPIRRIISEKSSHNGSQA